MQHNNFVMILTFINIFVVVVDSLFIVALSVCGGFVLIPLFCNAVLSVHSSFAIILLRKRELAAYFNCAAVSVLKPFPHGVIGWSVIVSFLVLPRLIILPFLFSKTSLVVWHCDNVLAFKCLQVYTTLYRDSFSEGKGIF